MRGDPENRPSEFVCGDGTRLSVSVRFSLRAKNRRLSLSHTGELEVIIPDRRQGLPLQDSSSDSVTDFLEQHRSWIERAARRSRQQRISFEESKAAGLPKQLEFPLCNELWLVEYQQTQALNVRAKSDGLRRFQNETQVLALKVSGAVSDEELCRRALVTFITQHAKQMIPIFAWEVYREVSNLVGIKPTSIMVNNRNSAWGICTREGDIRIDRRVLFLPRNLARQVVLHELAHLKHLNHSVDFHQELYSYPGSTKEAEKAVKQAIQFVPAWFLL
ncbi:MAG: M48 family metallopeptidase [Coriobacteriia bacterium]|nr:M48 family metallopeptidase [Coriobacteriia bacterium]